MDLATIKQHLYVEHALDDTLITHYSDAAEHAIASYTHSTYDNLNKSHEQAKLLLIGTWYSFRENEVTLNFTELPMGIKFLLDMQMSVVL